MGDRLGTPGAVVFFFRPVEEGRDAANLPREEKRFFDQVFASTQFVNVNFDTTSRQRPYHVENTSSRPITEVKQHWAWLVLGWVTAWEHQVLLSSFFAPWKKDAMLRTCREKRSDFLIKSLLPSSLSTSILTLILDNGHTMLKTPVLV